MKVPAVSKHIKNIYDEGELDLLSTVSKKEIVRKEGSRGVDERTLLIVDKRSKDVVCIVYTRYCEQVDLDFQKHNQQCAPIQKVQLPHAVHDRYLIVDNEVWLLGASVKDMGRGLCTIIRLGFTPDDILSRI